MKDNCIDCKHYQVCKYIDFLKESIDVVVSEIVNVEQRNSIMSSIAETIFEACIYRDIEEVNHDLHGR